MAEAIRAFGELSGGAQILLAVMICLIAIVAYCAISDIANFLAADCRAYFQLLLRQEHEEKDNGLKEE